MPQSSERKREYNRERQRQRRGFYSPSKRGMGREYERGEGVVPTRRNVVPPLEKRDVVPSNPWTMTKRKLVDYLAYVGQRGFTLVYTERGYELMPAYAQAPSYKVLEGRVGILEARNTQLEGEMARLEAMLDSVLHESRE